MRSPLFFPGVPMCLRLTALFLMFSSGLRGQPSSLRGGGAQNLDSLRAFLQTEVLNNPDSSQQVALAMLDLAKAQNDMRGIFDALGYLGLSAGMVNEMDKALGYFRQQQALLDQIDDVGARAAVLTHLGNVFNYKEELDSAAYYWLAALHYFEEIGAYDQIASCYNNIGLVYEKQEAWEPAKNYYIQSLELRKKHGAEDKLGFCYNRLGNVYLAQGDYFLASAYYEKYLEHSRTYGLKREEANALSNLGNLAKAKGETDKAIAYYRQSLSLFEKLHANYFIAYLHNNLSEALLQAGKGEVALFHAEKAYSLAENMEQLELRRRAAGLVARAAAKLKQYQKAYEASLRVNELAADLVKKEHLKEFARLEANYQFEKKQKQLAEKELALQRELAAKKYIFGVSFGLVLLLLLLFLYLRNRYRVRQKLAELQAQMTESELVKLREINDFKSEFVINLSHELKTPLTLILSAVEEEKEQFNSANRQLIEKYAHRLLRLVDRLLKLARLESGKLLPQPSRGILSDFLCRELADFEVLAKKEGISLQSGLGNGLAQSYFDKEIVRTIFSNLLSNAFKFCKRGDEIYVGMKREGRYVHLEVRDTGPGMNREVLEQVFERFSAMQPSLLQKSSGLGLALSRELARAHGGDIEVFSEKGKGSTFRVSLRTDRAFFEEAGLLYRDDRLLFEQNREKLRESLPEPDGKDLPLLLIVEDSDELRLWLGRHLKEQYAILYASDGREALQKIYESLPDLVLLDVSIPLLDGFEVCQRMKTDERSSHIPVVMLTAYGEQEMKMQGLSCGASAYLTKPFLLREVRIRLSNLLEERKRLQEKLQKELVPFSSLSTALSEQEENFLLRLRKQIEQHISDEHFSISELAGKMHLSRSQLHRKVKALTGCAPQELLRRMRLLYASELLKQKKHSIAEVAYQCGFSSSAYFSSCFKDYFGYSPRESH